MSTEEERIALARVLKEERGYPNAEIAKAMGITKNEVQELLGVINWGYNCLTVGIHHGRPEVLWNLPLLQAATHMFSADELKELVISRIYTDALIMVNRGDEPRPSEAWAEKVKELAEERYSNTLQHKIGEISTYYKSSTYKNDVQGVVERVKDNRLNPHYEPLHSHDSINMLCRIIGVSSSIEASR
jgi:hypothetical protein